MDDYFSQLHKWIDVYKAQCHENISDHFLDESNDITAYGGMYTNKGEGGGGERSSEREASQRGWRGEREAVREKTFD